MPSSVTAKTLRRLKYPARSKGLFAHLPTCPSPSAPTAPELTLPRCVNPTLAA